MYYGYQDYCACNNQWPQGGFIQQQVPMQPVPLEQDMLATHSNIANLLASLARKLKDLSIDPELVKAKIENFMTNRDFSVDVGSKIPAFLQAARCMLASVRASGTSVATVYPAMGSLIQEAANVAAKIVQKQLAERGQLTR